MDLSIETNLALCGVSAEDIKDRLHGREADLIRSYRGPPNPKLSNTNEMRWGTHGSLKLTLSGRQAGLWYDHERGHGGDAFSFIMQEEGCSFTEALEIASDYCGGAPSSPNVSVVPQRNTAHAVEEALDAERRTAQAFAIWQECSPAQATLGAKYLHDRGYELPEDADEVLRFHGECPWENGKRPALVAAITDSATDEFIGIHRTALDLSGAKIGRKVLGLAGGGAIKLFPVSGSSLGIGEGIETALAGFAMRGLPMWSVLNAGNMNAFPVLPEVQRLHVLVDHDPGGAGQRAAAAVEQRYLDAGRTVELIMPKTVGHDMDDEWRSKRVLQ